MGCHGSAPPAGFIGDVNVDHAVTGSPFGTNFVRLDGPNAGGLGVNTVSTNLFSVTGQIDGRLAAPLTIDRTSYARSSTATEVDLFAHSAGNATIVGSGTGIPTTTLTQDAATGCFVARLSLAAGAAPPAVVRYTVTATGSDTTIRDTPVTDEVLITKVTYSVASHVLTVNATSSDKVAPPTLTASGSATEPLGTLSAAGVLTATLTAPPYQVQVKSSKGGVDTLIVDLLP